MSSVRTSYEHGDSMSTEYDQTNHPTNSTPHSLSHAVQARRAEYTRPHTVKVKIGTWNVAACPGTDKDIAGWFVDGKGVDKELSGLDHHTDESEYGEVPKVESVDAQEIRRKKNQPTIPLNDESLVVGGDEVGLYVLGLQEVVELSSAKEYISRVYTDLGPLVKWKAAVSSALPVGYELVSEMQLSGLLLLIYASPAVMPTISSVSSVAIGTGIMGYLGNKGGISTRIVLGETTRLVFVNSHLASGTDQAHLDRRCWDVVQILNRTQFTPINHAGVVDDVQESIGEEDFAFWFGDLNFRLDGLPGDDIRRLLLLHTKGEYGSGTTSKLKIDSELEDEPIHVHLSESDDDDDSVAPSNTATKSSHDSVDTSSSTLPDPDDFQDPHADPESLQATLDSLLPHDQLRKVQKERKAFHDGWREGPITFLPTYKYDIGSMGMFDSSEKKRAPSWCDRILYRTRRDKMEYDGKSQEEELARIKDEEMKARGIDHAGDDEEVLFDYNPDADGVEVTTTGTTDDYDEYDEEETAAQEVVTKDGFIDRIRLDIYTSHQRVLSSDHKPISGVFTLDYDAVVSELKKKVHEECAKILDRAENEGRPGITIAVDHSQGTNDALLSSTSASSPEDEEVDFGEVGYLRRKSRTLTIANTSQVEARFAFVERPFPNNKTAVAPSWLTISYVDPETDGLSLQKAEQEIVLEPGDTINVALEAFVSDVDYVKALNNCTEKLDDVLVLRVADGRDHFLPVRGTWLQSCFGRSIDDLVRIPEGGVRALRPSRKGEGAPVNRGENVCWSAPRELFKLTEAVETLTERVLADKEMIEDIRIPESNGWPFEDWTNTDQRLRETHRALLLEALDADKNLLGAFPPELISTTKLEIVSEVLVLFLASFSDGIITEELWKKVDADLPARQLSAEEERDRVLEILSSSPNNNISLVFLTTMLSKVARELAPSYQQTKNNISSAQSSPQRNTTSTGSALIPSTISTWTNPKSPEHRRSLSFKRGNVTPIDPAVSKRTNLENRYAKIFTPVVFQKPEKDNLKRGVEDKKTKIIELFIKGS